MNHHIGSIAVLASVIFGVLAAHPSTVLHYTLKVPMDQTQCTCTNDMDYTEFLEQVIGNGLSCLGEGVFVTVTSLGQCTNETYRNKIDSLCSNNYHCVSQVYSVTSVFTGVNESRSLCDNIRKFFNQFPNRKKYNLRKSSTLPDWPTSLLTVKVASLNCTDSGCHGDTSCYSDQSPILDTTRATAQFVNCDGQMLNKSMNFTCGASQGAWQFITQGVGQNTTRSSQGPTSTQSNLVQATTQSSIDQTSAVSRTFAKPGTGTGQTTTKSGTGTGQTNTALGTGTGQESTKPGTGTRQTTTRPGTGTGQTTTRPGTGTGRTNTTLGKGTGYTTTRPGTGTGQTNTTLGKGTGQTNTTLGTVTGRTTTRPGTGTGQESTKPGTGTGKTTTKPGLGTGQTTIRPGTGTGQTNTTLGKGTGQTNTTLGTGTGQTNTTPGTGTGQTTTRPGTGTGQTNKTPGTGTGQDSIKPGTTVISTGPGQTTTVLGTGTRQTNTILGTTTMITGQSVNPLGKMTVQTSSQTSSKITGQYHTYSDTIKITKTPITRMYVTAWTTTTSALGQGESMQRSTDVTGGSSMATVVGAVLGSLLALFILVVVAAVVRQHVRKRKRVGHYAELVGPVGLFANCKSPPKTAAKPKFLFPV